ncbi:hypothetical protein pb186bvf_002081 [Paramecium bursaria]
MQNQGGQPNQGNNQPFQELFGINPNPQNQQTGLQAAQQSLINQPQGANPQPAQTQTNQAQQGANLPSIFGGQPLGQAAGLQKQFSFSGQEKKDAQNPAEQAPNNIQAPQGQQNPAGSRFELMANANPPTDQQAQQGNRGGLGIIGLNAQPQQQKEQGQAAPANKPPNSNFQWPVQGFGGGQNIPKPEQPKQDPMQQFKPPEQGNQQAQLGGQPQGAQQTDAQRSNPMNPVNPVNPVNPLAFLGMKPPQVAPEQNLGAQADQLGNAQKRQQTDAQKPAAQAQPPQINLFEALQNQLGPGQKYQGQMILGGQLQMGQQNQQAPQNPQQNQLSNPQQNPLSNQQQNLLGNPQQNLLSNPQLNQISNPQQNALLNTQNPLQNTLQNTQQNTLPNAQQNPQQNQFQNTAQNNQIGQILGNPQLMPQSNLMFGASMQNPIQQNTQNAISNPIQQQPQVQQFNLQNNISFTQTIPSGLPTQAQQVQQPQKTFQVPQKSLRQQGQGALAQRTEQEPIHQSSEDDHRERIKPSKQYQQEQQKWDEFYKQQKQNFLAQVKANIQGDGQLTFPDNKNILRIVQKDEVEELKKCLKDNPSVYRRLLYGPRWYSLEIGEFQSELNNIGYLRSRAFSNKIPDWAFEAIKQSLDESNKKKLQQDYYQNLPQEVRQQAYLQLIYDIYVHYCDQRAKLAEAQYYLIASGLEELGTLIRPSNSTKNFIYDQFLKHTQFYDCLYTNYMEQREIVKLFNTKIYKQGELEQYNSSDESDNEQGTSYERVMLAVGTEQKWTLSSLYLLQFYFREDISKINNFFKYYTRQYVHQTIFIAQKGIFFQSEALTNKKKQGAQLKAQICLLSEALVLGYSKKPIHSNEFMYPQEQFYPDLIIEEQFIERSKLSIYFLQKLLFFETLGQAPQTVYSKKLIHIYQYTMNQLEFLCKGIKKYFTQSEIHFAIESFIMMVVLASFKNIEKLAIKQEKIAHDILAVEHVFKEILDSKLISNMFEKQYEHKVPEIVAVFNSCRRRHIFLQKYKQSSLKLLKNDNDFLIYVFTYLDQLSTDQKLQYKVNRSKSKAKKQYTENSMALYTSNNIEQPEEEIQHHQQIKRMLKLYQEIKDIIKFLANQATVDPEFIEKITLDFVKNFGKEEIEYLYLYRAITTLLNDASEKISPKFHHHSFENMHKIVLSISYHCLQIFKAFVNNPNTYVIIIKLIDDDISFDERRNCLIRVQYSCKSLEQAKMYPYPQICSIQQQTMQILQQFLLHDYIYADLKIKTQESISINFFDQLFSFYTTQLLADWGSYAKFQNAKMYPLWKEMIYTLYLILGKFVFHRYEGYQETYLHETMIVYLNQVDSVVILDLINTQLEVEVKRTFLNNTTNHIYDENIRDKIGVTNRLLNKAQDNREQEYITGTIIRTIQLCSTLMDLIQLQKPQNLLLIVKDFNEYLQGTSNLRYRKVFMPSQIDQKQQDKPNLEVSIQLDISHYMLAILKIIDDQYELEWANLDQKGYEWMEEYDNQQKQQKRYRFLDSKPFLSRNQPKKMTLFQSAIRLLTKFTDLETRLTKISYIDSNNHTYTRSLSYKQFIFQLLQLIVIKLTNNDNDDESIDIVEFFIVQTIRKQSYMEYLFVKSSIDSKAIQQENVRRFLFSFERRSKRSMRYDLVTLMYFNLILNETYYCQRLREQCRSEFSGLFIERIIAPICQQLSIPLAKLQQSQRIEQQKQFVLQQNQSRELSRMKQYEDKKLSELEIKYAEIQRKLNELQIDKQKIKNLQTTLCLSQSEYEQEILKIHQKEKLHLESKEIIRRQCDQSQRQQQILESKIRDQSKISQQRQSKVSEQSDLLGSNVRQASNVFSKQQVEQQSILKKSSYGNNRPSVIIDEQDDIITIQSFYDLYKETKPNQLEQTYLEQTILEYTYDVATLEQLLIFLLNESRHQITCNDLINDLLNKSTLQDWLALLIAYSNTEFYNQQYYYEYKEAYNKESKFKFQNQIVKMDYLAANFFSFGRDYGYDTIAIFYHDVGISNDEDFPFVVDKLIRNQRLNLLHSWFTIMKKTLVQIEKFTLYALSFQCNKPFTYSRLYQEERNRFINIIRESLTGSKDDFNQFISKTTALLSPNENYKLMRQSTRFDSENLVGFVRKILGDVRTKFFNDNKSKDDAPPEFIDPQLLSVGHYLSAIHIQKIEPAYLEEVQQFVETHFFMLNSFFNYNQTTAKIILNNIFKNLQLVVNPKTVKITAINIGVLLGIFETFKIFKKDITVVVKVTEIINLIMFKLKIIIEFDYLKSLFNLQNEFMREKQHGYQYTGTILQFWSNICFVDKTSHHYLVENQRTINTLGRQVDFQNLSDYESYKFIMWNYSLIYLKNILNQLSMRQILDFVEIHFNRIQETLIFEDVKLKGLQYNLDKRSLPKYMRLFEVNNILKLFLKILLKSEDALREGYTQMIDKILYLFLNVIPQTFGQFNKVQPFLKSYNPQGALEHKLQQFGRQADEQDEQKQDSLGQDTSFRRSFQPQNSAMSITNPQYKPEQTLNRITSYQLLIIIEQIFVQRYQIQGTIMSFSKYKINRTYKYEESFIQDFQKNILNYLRFNLDMFVQLKNNKSLDWPQGLIKLLYQNFDFVCYTGKLFTIYDQVDLSDEVVVNFIYGLQAISNFLRIKHSLNYIIRVQDIKNNNENFIKETSLIIEKFNQSANIPNITLNGVYKLKLESTESADTYWRLWQRKLKQDIDQLDKLN